MKTTRLRRWIVRGAIVLAAIPVVLVLRHLAYRQLLAEKRAVRTYVIETENGLQGRQDGPLRLAAFNIAHGRGTNSSNWSSREERRSRLREIAALLREKADIAVLSEVDFDATWSDRENQASFLAREAGFRFVMEQRNFDLVFPFYRIRFGNAVLSRFPIESAWFVKLPPRSEWEHRLAGSKQGSVAEIRLNDDLTIRIFAVHLEWRDGLTRGRSSDVLAAVATNSTVPFFCAGDFNCDLAATNAPSSSASALDELLFRTTLQPINPLPTESRDFTYSSLAPNRTIDWILIPKEWEFMRYEVLDIRLSDHRPVFAEVRAQKNP